MQTGREIDIRIAQEIFEFEVFLKDETYFEKSGNEERPLKFYSRDIQSAWLVAEKMRVSLIPVENRNWFAFIDPEDGWSAPEAFLNFLKEGNFTQSGASVGDNAALVICEAALVANQKREIHLSAKKERTLVVVRDLSPKEGKTLLFPSNKDDSSIIH